VTRALRWLCGLHLIGNAALLGVGYWWLSVGESTTANLSLSIALLIVFTVGAAWLHGTSLVYFREPHPPKLRVPMRGLLPLVALAITSAVIYFALDAWQPLNTDRATNVASYLTLKTQTPIRPAAVQRVFDVLWWIVLWALIPVLLLPLASGIASLGLRGVREFGTRLKDWRYWLMAPALLSVAIWAPLEIVAWKPSRGTFAVELAGFALRFGLAYLLFVGAWLLLAFVTSRGKPSRNQPTTVPSP